MDTLGEGFGAGGLHGDQAIGGRGAEDLDDLPITVRHVLQLAPDALERSGQVSVRERRPVPQSARLAGEHRHVVPGIVDRLAAAKGPPVLADDPPVLADLDALGIGPDLDRMAARCG